jgi:hypothetical protein
MNSRLSSALEPIVARLGVDFHQYRHLLRLSLTLDFRRRNVQLDAHTTQSALVMTCVIYGIMSLVLSLLSFRVVGVFHYSLSSLLFSMMIMALIVLSEFGATIISPDDYEILGHRPVDSRTYFAVKVSNLFFYVLLLGSSLNFFPAVVGAFGLNSRGYFPLVYFPVALLANVFSASLVILFYGALLRFVNYEKFKDVITYFQVIFSFLMFFGYQLVPRSIQYLEKDQSATLNRWLLIIPPGWFASLVEVGLGQGERDHVVWAAWGAITTVFLLWVGLRSFSLDYSAHIARLRATTASSTRTKTGFFGRVFKPLGKLFLKQPEDRAAFYLVRQMLKRNRVLKLRLYPALGFPLAFIALGYLNKSLGDPFLPDQKFQKSIFSFFATMVGPMISQAFYSLLPYSEEHAAGWVFRVTPIGDLARFFSSVKRAFIVSFLIPVFVFLAVLFSLLPGWTIGHAVIHAAFGLAMSYLHLMFLFLFYRGGFPFAQEPIKAVQTQQMTIGFISLPIYAVFIGMQYFVYSRQALIWLAAALIVIIGIVLNKAGNFKAARATRQLYEAA